MNELSSLDIIEILNSYNIEPNGVYQKDMLPYDLDSGFYIVNLQSSNDGNGTHWCSLYYSPTLSIWFDAFGFKPPEDVEERIGKYIYNSYQIQDIKSSSCGYFCIAFIKFLYPVREKEKAFNVFVNLFKQNKLANEKVLYELLYRPKL
jgi:hypothetical protein